MFRSEKIIIWSLVGLSVACCILIGLAMIEEQKFKDKCDARGGTFVSTESHYLCFTESKDDK